MGRHRQMADRNRSKIQKRLYRDGVTLDDISNLCGVSLTTTHRCLDQQRFNRVSHGDLFSVRNAIAVLTYGEIVDWSEYDDQIKCARFSEVEQAAIGS